jgi:hypothetical protein
VTRTRRTRTQVTTASRSQTTTWASLVQTSARTILGE